MVLLAPWMTALADSGTTFVPFITNRRPPTSLQVPPMSAYTTRPGDTLLSLAGRFHRSLDQMVCALPAHFDPGRPLQPGMRLLIPPKRSMCHVIAEGQTLAAVARAYGVTVGDIIALPQNELRIPPYFAPPGTRVLVPLPPKVEVVPWAYGDGHFRWPVRGTITQPWSPRHRGLDIATDEGTSVVAADTGRVRWAGWDTTGYGWLIILDHGNGYRTYYAHLRSIWVSKGERVIRGEPIGIVGSTGHSTGPHLHFEIRDYGVSVNPLTLLPRRPALSASPSSGAAREGQ